MAKVKRSKAYIAAGGRTIAQRMATRKLVKLNKLRSRHPTKNTIQVFDRGAGYGWGVRIVEDKTHEYSAGIYEEKEARKFAALVKDFLNAGLSRSEAWSSAWKIAVKW